MYRFVLLIVLSLATSWLRAQDAQRVSGHVIDTSGAAIANARVELRCGNQTKFTTSSPAGAFSFPEVEAKPCTISASAHGLSSRTIPALPESTLTLSPTLLQQEVSVTASRGTVESDQLPVSGTSKNEAQLQVEPALTVDDKLRQVPGFALFRRSGSETANPTTQGVSLRGLGASGASRSLVLRDGVPVNDPFGGWIYWGRVPVESIEQIDIVEGGVSDLYGSNALGGVINIMTRNEVQTAFSGETSYGSLTSPFGSMVGSVRVGSWGATLAGEGFKTIGYVPVRADQRGPIDQRAGSNHGTADLLIERSFKNSSRAFLRGSLYGESRENGTLLQENRATLRQLEAGGDWYSTRAGSLSLRVFGGTENLHQTFSSINSTRTTETLTVDQRVPVAQGGFSVQWSRLIGHQMLAAGVDGRDVIGDTNELQYSLGKYSAKLIAGGRQQTIGVFGEDVWQITPRWLVTGSLRFDRWSNSDASSRRFPAAGMATDTPFPDRSETAFSPRVGVTRVLSDQVSIYAAGYRSFREPTLNELYRSFRVGNVVTQSNPFLKAEHFSGGEIGTRIQPKARWQLRANAFGGVLDDPVGNITLSTTPTLITRERQNIGRIRLLGAELASDAKITNAVTFSVAYQLTDATVNDNPADPTLVGKVTPLVPRHAVTFAATYTNPKVVTFSIQGRSNSTEYDDDQNTLALDPYFNLGAYIERKLRPGLQLFAAAENLLNSQYDIGRTPVPTVAAPRLLRLGLRFEIQPTKK